MMSIRGFLSDCIRYTRDCLPYFCCVGGSAIEVVVDSVTSSAGGAIAVPFINEAINGIEPIVVKAVDNELKEAEDELDIGDIKITVARTKNFAAQEPLPVASHVRRLGIDELLPKGIAQ